MRCTLVDVIDVEVLDGYRLHLQFDDGAQGVVDISKLVPFKGIFEALNDKEFFSRVSVNPDIGTICWENGADLSPTSLRESIQTEKK
jgi:hypothetical protein